MALQSCEVYAHTLPNRGEADWETLEAHSAAVAKLAREFTEPFHAGELGSVPTAENEK